MNQNSDNPGHENAPHPSAPPALSGETTPKAASLKDRQVKIQQLVKAKGFVTIDSLAREFDVTPQTIRRDINTLSDRGMINRYHGGAGANSSIENVGYNERKVLCFKEKQKIAHMVAGEIPDHASLFINIGTTTEAIAQALCNHKRLRIITNNLNVAGIMSANANF